MHAHTSFRGFALRRAFTNATAASRGIGASMLWARKPYSLEIDMHARRNTSLTASAGVGMAGFIDQFLRRFAVRLHGFIFDAAL